MTKKIAILVGSLRKDSYNRKMAHLLSELAPNSMKLEIIDIGSLPFFNQDEEENPPKGWINFREKIKECDGVLFLTPEYNRSVPAVLKNAIDVGSRPYGQSVWDGKPCAVMSVSPGATGGFGANHHLRQCLVFLNMPTLQQPEAYIGRVHELFDDKGNIANEDSKKFLQKFIDAFAKWVELNSKAA